MPGYQSLEVGGYSTAADQILAPRLGLTGIDRHLSSHGIYSFRFLGGTVVARPSHNALRAMIMSLHGVGPT